MFIKIASITLRSIFKAAEIKSGDILLSLV